MRPGLPFSPLPLSAVELFCNPGASPTTMNSLAIEQGGDLQRYVLGRMRVIIPIVDRALPGRDQHHMLVDTLKTAIDDFYGFRPDVIQRWPWLADPLRFYVGVEYDVVGRNISINWSEAYQLFFVGRLDDKGHPLPTN